MKIRNRLPHMRNQTMSVGGATVKIDERGETDVDAKLYAILIKQDAWEAVKVRTAAQDPKDPAAPPEGTKAPEEPEDTAPDAKPPEDPAATQEDAAAPDEAEAGMREALSAASDDELFAEAKDLGVEVGENPDRDAIITAVITAITALQGDASNAPQG